MMRFKKHQIIIISIFISFVIFWNLVFCYYSNDKVSLKKMYINWDGDQYYSIAESGYQLDEKCAYDIKLCGNVGWFPFYPLVSSFFSLLFGTAIAMIFVSWTCFLISLFLLFRLVSDEYSELVAYITIIVLCTFPTSFYFLLGFPYSLFLMISLMIFLLLKKNKMFLSSLLEGMLIITYPSGILIYIPKVYYFIKNNNISSLKLFFKNILSLKNLAIFIIPIGFLFAYFSYYYFKFNDFFLYSHFQSQAPFFRHHITFPLIPIFSSLYYELSRIAFSPEGIMFILIIATFIIFGSKRLGALYWTYLGAFILFTPTFGTTAAVFRQYLVAFPLFLLVATSKRHWIFKVLFCIFIFLLGVIYYANVYISGSLL